MNPPRHHAHPTRADAEHLIAWLPVLYAPDFRIDLPREERSSPEGWWPEYTEEVEAFYRELAGGAWMDYGYDRSAVGELLRSERIAVATLPEVRSMLTFVLRSERFGDGMWSAGITSGVVRMLLERVGVLLKEGVFPEETE